MKKIKKIVFNNFLLMLIVVGLILLVFRGLFDVVSGDDTKKTVVLVTSVDMWKNYSFDIDLPIYNNQGITDFYLPLVVKKSDYADLKIEHIDKKIDKTFGSFSERYRDTNVSIIENNDYYAIIYHVSIFAGEGSMGFDFVPKIKGIEYPEFAWFNSSWLYRVGFEVDKNQVGGILKNFPALVKCTNSTILAGCRADGGDVVFVDSTNTTKYNHEIDVFNLTTGLFWVNFTNVDNVANLYVNMYFGNPSVINQTNKNGVWDTDYLGVWHLNDDNDSNAVCNDSTIYNRWGMKVSAGNPSMINTGVVGNAQFFTDDEIVLATGIDCNIRNLDWMYECWLKPDSVPHQIEVFDRYQAGSNKFYCYYNTNDVMAYAYTGVGTEMVIGDTNQAIAYTSSWCYFVYGEDRDVSGYIGYNGTYVKLEQNIFPTSDYNINQPLKVGRYASNNLDLHGSMDEIRISKVLRNQSYTVTTYNCIINTSTFIKWGTIENYVPPVLHVPLCVNFSIVNNSNNNFIWKNFSCYVYDVIGDKIYYSIVCTNGYSTIGNCYNGTIYLNFTNANNLYTNYTIWVNVTDDNSSYNRYYLEFKTNGEIDIMTSSVLSFSPELVSLLFWLLLIWFVVKSKNVLLVAFSSAIQMFMCLYMFNTTSIFSSMPVIYLFIGVFIMAFGLGRILDDRKRNKKFRRGG